MSKILASLAVVAIAMAAGQAAGPIRYTLTDAAGTPTVQDSESASVEFDGVAPGDYTVTAVRLDSTGAAIGSPVSGSVTVPSPVVGTVDVLQVGRARRSGEHSGHQPGHHGRCEIERVGRIDRS